MRFPEHLQCSSVRSKTQSFHPISVNFVIEILASRISYLIPHHFPHRLKANEFRQLCFLKNIRIIEKIFACKKNQNSQLTINNFPPFRVGEKKIVSVKVALSIGAVVLHKTQCLRFLIRDLHLITTSPHHHIITSSRINFHPASKRMNFANFAPLKT